MRAGRLQERSAMKRGNRKVWKMAAVGLLAALTVMFSMIWHAACYVTGDTSYCR